MWASPPLAGDRNRQSARHHNTNACRARDIAATLPSVKLVTRMMTPMRDRTWCLVLFPLRQAPQDVYFSAIVRQEVLSATAQKAIMRCVCDFTAKELATLLSRYVASLWLTALGQRTGRHILFKSRHLEGFLRDLTGAKASKCDAGFLWSVRPLHLGKPYLRDAGKTSLNRLSTPTNWINTLWSVWEELSKEKIEYLSFQLALSSLRT